MGLALLGLLGDIIATNRVLIEEVLLKMNRLDSRTGQAQGTQEPGRSERRPLIND